MYESINMFEVMNPRYKIKKPIRLIELFAGIGSQAKALKNIDANFETYKVVEYDSNAIKSYNAIHNTDFVVQDITKINSSDLCIVDTNKYEYIMTYSFPCQDLSLAGNQKGMGKGSSTRSGLLWEVERLLKGCVELPQILLMENVPQVVGKANFKDFREWEIFLEDLGYSNYYQLLNAKDYGIPQNRNRCYMVSVLGNYYYQFPCKKKLELRLKDFLEDEVDEKYYLSDKMIEGMKNTNFESYKLENKLLDKNGIASTIIARFEGAPQCIEDTKTTMCINSKVNGKQPSLQDRVYDSKGISTAITTSFMPSIVVKEPTIAASRGRNIENPSDRTKGIELEQRLELNKEGLCNTITTVQKDNYLIVPETPAHEGDGVYIDRPHQKRGVVQKGMIQTIKTSGDDVGVVVKNNIKNINEEDGVFSTLGTNCGSSTSAGGGLHGKDLSKADVSVNIYAWLKSQETGVPVELCCAIGDEYIDNRPYEEVVEIAREFIFDLGGFEKFAEWGLV